jgi:hypothetical protein
LLDKSVGAIVLSGAIEFDAAVHHAKLAVYAAMTLADFLFETKNYQHQRGALGPK